MNQRNNIILRGSANAHELARAIFYAGRAGEESLLDAISSYLDHRDPDVRGAAIQALVFSMEKEQYFEKAIEMLQDEAFGVRLLAMSGLGCIARKKPELRERAIAALMAFLRAAPSSLDAHKAYRSLKELGVVPFRQWDEEPPSEVLASVEAAMGKLPEPR